MEYALSVPEVLDHIFRLAVPSAQVAAAQVCQQWSEHSLRLIWRSLPSIYPPLRHLAPLIRRHNEWRFETDLFDADWKRFNRHTAYTRSICYDDRDSFLGHAGLPAWQVFAEVCLHRPPSDGPIWPNLDHLRWTSHETASLIHAVSFLTPSITSLQISCAGPRMADACAKLLRTLEPRQVFLSHLDLALPQYDQTLLISLPLTLSHQTRLVTVTLPSYSATRDVVAALGRLPHLKEYAIWDFLAYQMPLEAGATFEWPLGSFVSLEKLSFIAPLTDASEIMGKEHQSRLRSLEIACRTPAQHHQLQSLSTKLSASLPHLTPLSLFLYSETFVPNTPEGLRFHSLHPLLQCRALSILVVGHNIPFAYTQNDVRTMAEAWPTMKFLRLCADPVDTVRYSSGQPLGSVGVFARYFPHLLPLGIYINTFEIPLKSQISNLKNLQGFAPWAS